MSNNNTINWFEVPVTDLDRASTFYEKVLNTKLEKTDMGPWKMGIFPGGGEASVHGALVQGDTYNPSEAGTLVYFNGGEDLATPLSRVESAGGKILKEKFEIGEHGFMALFQDTEGNRMALHSMK